MLTSEDIEQIHPQDFLWRFWPVVPIYPYGERRTICKEVIKDTIWIFDQLQGIFYVVVPIRMTVVKLEKGGLLVYAPVAPTGECIRLLNELISKHGNIKYIILPTISGIEHKVFVGPFARRFPTAQVFVAPGQWSFPINLPLSWLGLPGKRTRILPENSQEAPFAEDFDYAILGPIDLGLGKFAEVAFFHKRSHTVLITDTIVSVPAEPPAIVQLDPYPLLYHAKDQAFDMITDTPANRLKGWQRVTLFALYFSPSVLEVPTWSQVWRDAKKAPERSRKAYFGFFPFQWRENWQDSFDILRGNGRIFVAPILQSLILNRAPQETINWADKVAKWDFQWIIPCHFDAPIKAEPQQFRQAFAFLEKQPVGGFVSSNSYLLPEGDFKLLRNIDAGLNKFGIVPPARERV
ncbi:DUF4336 domain-containing protein [Aphanizomenon flos-aquae NRERC-008]|uniref:DUF4336 domain-containing protein n=1 Tax=Aphanizomenon flos-aquae FACHB-1249 TaxID=2692889 RepID=A0ABR8IRH3_APHFL|nr:MULTISPECIES: DUF4336 domain-containing protein [Aphanizomenon]MBD2392394.1 DUF4336 domain-containing protein [Aphanizomenon flos-aquae FACHB-1171]MBD2558627.1 DUF4336 domain-containing protein [Aphanizomenon flos-aquae FACHB-1290]MBD2632307.1 DUF4336 domain-containing protein [Aphanizomenon sp. FACHB-1399]MBD2659106.1 DUF4336 domain-containing protein [Aphanizomenon flos-aquae FACHB-1265]MBD2674679.1 DUF4336 domain-containing protein [Aphanizomenon flos-aquae FACHB-1416]MBD2685935.1 DUF43